MSKYLLLIFTTCALALSACGATTPVPLGFMTQNPGSNAPYNYSDD
jgi:hypothetical protein